jgi:Transposase DDE domain
MNDYSIAIYGFLDDFCKKIELFKENQKIRDAEILTAAILAARFFGGNHQSALCYLKSHFGLCKLDKSNFNRRLHKLSYIISLIFYQLANTIKELNINANYIIDSFPIAICKNIRNKRNKRIPYDKFFHGYNESKKEYFYGYKLQVIVNEQGLPVFYTVHAGSIHDITAFQNLHIDLPENAFLYGDSGYTDYSEEDNYADIEHIYLKIVRKSNSLRQDSPAQAALKDVIRKQVENTFAQITARFPKKIHATTAGGFILKIVLFLLSFTFEKLI